VVLCEAQRQLYNSVIPPYIFMVSCLVKYRIRLHGVVLYEAHRQLYLYNLVIRVMAWCSVKYRIRLHGVVFSGAHGLYLYSTFTTSRFQCA
jgi:hypothetical protein